MKFKAIIFDMDGTIVNTENAWRKATHDLIEARGRVLSEAEKTELHRLFNGLALYKCCDIIKERFKLDDHIDDIAQEKLQRAHDLMQTEMEFIKGFQEFHNSIEHAKIPHAIATNADDHTINLINKSVELHRYFSERIYGISRVNNVYKPRPDIYLYAANQLGINPKECLAIEDSFHGVQAAKNAGMTCIGINSSNKPEYIKYSDYKVNTYHDINLEDL